MKINLHGFTNYASLPKIESDKRGVSFVSYSHWRAEWYSLGGVYWRREEKGKPTQIKALMTVFFICDLIFLIRNLPISSKVIRVSVTVKVLIKYRWPKPIRNCLTSIPINDGRSKSLSPCKCNSGDLDWCIALVYKIIDWNIRCRDGEIGCNKAVKINKNHRRLNKRRSSSQYHYMWWW